MDYTGMNTALMDVFGQPATYNGEALTVIDDSEYLEQMGISGYTRAVAVLNTDVDTLGITVGGTLITDGATYRVASPPQRDVGGLAVLVLEEQ